jgi:hypothetical protein
MIYVASVLAGLTAMIPLVYYGRKAYVVWLVLRKQYMAEIIVDGKMEASKVDPATGAAIMTDMTPKIVENETKKWQKRADRLAWKAVFQFGLFANHGVRDGVPLQEKGDPAELPDMKKKEPHKNLNVKDAFKVYNEQIAKEKALEEEEAAKAEQI